MKGFPTASPAVLSKLRGLSGSRKRMLAVVCLVLLVAIACVLIFMIARTEKQPVKPAAKSGLSPQQQALVSSQQGSYGPAKKIMLEQISADKTDADKARDYATLASVALSAQEYADARTYAQQSEKLAPSFESANALGDIAMQKGNKAEAARYYQLAVDRLPKHSPSYRTRLSELNHKLERARS